MLQPQLMLQPQQDVFATAAAVSLPVLNIGLPTSASTSIADFFECAVGKTSLKASHYQCELDDGQADFCGQCVRRNIEAGLPALVGCGHYDIFAQIDGPWTGTDAECNLPQVSHLYNLHTAYPNATFVLPLMPAEKWVDIITDWYPEGRLRNQFSKCNLPLCPEPCVENNAKFAAFYHRHTAAVRKFVTKHPSHKLIEINVEGETAVVASKLAAATGFPATCWAPEKAGAKTWPVVAEGAAPSSHLPKLKKDDTSYQLAPADGVPLPSTHEGPTICTDMDLTMGIAARSAFAGLCCTYCDHDRHAGKICCPTKGINTGDDVRERPATPHKPAPTSHTLALDTRRTPFVSESLFTSRVAANHGTRAHRLHRAQHVLRPGRPWRVVPELGRHHACQRGG